MLKRVGLIIAVIMSLSACVTPSSINVSTLSETLSDPRVNKFPLKTTAHGRWVVTVEMNETQSVEMLLDTGATYSAFFEDTVQDLELQIDPENTIRIHGLITNSEVSIANVKAIKFGQDIYVQKTFAILPHRKGQSEDIIAYDGIIGMDIMKNYRIYVDRDETQIYFIPNEMPDIQPPPDMRQIPLYPNPYGEIGPELHFLTLNIKHNDVPALLDTGTEVHVSNWHAANFVEAKAVRKRLKWKWELAGAIGQFKPVVRAHVSKLEAVNYKWTDVNMIIKDTDSLEILGVADQPFIVAGVNLLDNRNAYIDFKNDNLWLESNYSMNAKDRHNPSICVSC